MRLVVDAVGGFAGVDLGLTWGKATVWEAMRWLPAGGLGRGKGDVRVGWGEVGPVGRAVVWMGSV